MPGEMVMDLPGDPLPLRTSFQHRYHLLRGLHDCSWGSLAHSPVLKELPIDVEIKKLIVNSMGHTSGAQRNPSFSSG
jgi:hypothetical protein